MAASALTWLETDPGVWRSTDGRYAIVAHVLPENPPRTVYQARKIGQEMAQAYPAGEDLGYLLEETPWCWCAENDADSAEAIVEQDAFASAHSASVPEDYPAVALSRFRWPISRGTSRGALVVARKDGGFVAQIVGMSRHGDSGFAPEPYTEINLTELGLIPQPGAGLDH